MLGVESAANYCVVKYFYMPVIVAAMTDVTLIDYLLRNQLFIEKLMSSLVVDPNPKAPKSLSIVKSH